MATVARLKLQKREQEFTELIEPSVSTKNLMLLLHFTLLNLKQMTETESNRKRKMFQSSQSGDDPTFLSTSKDTPESAEPNQIHRSTNSINRLPFDCFFIIFSHFPLQTRISLRLVSYIWNANIAQICVRKNRLTLAPFFRCAGPCRENDKDLAFMDDVSDYVSNRKKNRHDYLEFCLRDSKWQCNFTEMFNNLTELRIHFDCCCSVASVCKFETFLQSFEQSKQLRTFSFWITANNLSPRENTKFLPSLYEMFEQNLIVAKFPVLKQLDLCINYNYDYYFARKQLNIDLATNNILEQLERFSFNLYTKVENIQPILAKLSSNLTYLSLNCLLINFHKDLQLFFDGVKFQESLTHLRLNRIRIDEFRSSATSLLQLAYDRFTCLTFVQLEVTFMGKCMFDHNWMKPLGKLLQLTELRLHEFRVHRFADDFISSHASPSSLPLVRKLTWCKCELLNDFAITYCNQQFDGDLFCLTLARQFPNVQQLTIVSGNLDSFEIGFKKEDEANNEAKLGEQVHANLDRHFVHLRKSVLDFDATEWRKDYEHCDSD